MLIIRAIIFKYFRHYLSHCLLILALWLTQSACMPLLQRTLSNHSATGVATMMVLGLLGMAMFAAWGLFISFIVHEAPLTGTTEFWMTRPISRTQLFISKYIIIAVFFALLPSLALVTGRALGLLPPHTATFAPFATLPLIFTNQLILSLCLMLPASLTRNTSQFVFAMLGIPLIFLSISLFAANKFDQALAIMRNHTALTWTLKTTLIAALTAIIYNQYLRRNRIITITATALLALLLLALWQLWPTIPKN
jgi:hypothetical protein